MDITDKVAQTLQEAPASFRDPLLTFLRQHQAGETPDIAALFIAIVELQDQINGLAHECDQRAEDATDTHRETETLRRRIDGLQQALFPR